MIECEHGYDHCPQCDGVYALAKDITSDCRLIPKGTKLTDVCVLPDRSLTALAHKWDMRIKLHLVPSDLHQHRNSLSEGASQGGGLVRSKRR